MCSFCQIKAETICIIFTKFGLFFNIIPSIMIIIIPFNIHMIIAFDMFISFKGKFFVYSMEYRGELE